MDFPILIPLIGSAQGFIIGSYILISPFFRNKVNNYLAIAIQILSLLMLNDALDAIGFYQNHRFLEILLDDVEWVFLFPVLILKYIIYTTNHPLQHQKRLNWLYVPFIFSFILNFVNKLDTSLHLYEIQLENKDDFFNLLFDIERISYFSFNLILVIVAFWILQQAVPKINQQQKLNWLRKLLLFILILNIVWIFIDVTADDENRVVFWIIFLGIVLFISWISYDGVYKFQLSQDQQEIFEILKLRQKQLANNEISAIKEVDGETSNEDVELSQSSTFDENNHHYQYLVRLMVEEFIFRDPSLSREMVAEKLGISTGYLSQLINSITESNFASFVNSFRIKDVKQMLLDKDFENYSLLAIGLEAGFNSKTTFYKVFKEETGLTPNQYKKRFLVKEEVI